MGYVMKETRISSTLVYNGFLKIDRDEVRLEDGRETVREVVRHKGAALVVPRTEDGKIIMVRQFRYAVDKECIEFPAGCIDENETPWGAGMRELKEETGYTSDVWHYGRCVHSSVGFSDERVWIYAAMGCRLTHEQKLDATEDVEVLKLELEDVHRYINNGSITDSKSLLAYYMFLR
jgi:ADP-ribose pyrophosphatase